MATLVACVAETPRWGVGCEFRRQVVVLFLWLPLSSCVVRKACIITVPIYNIHNVAVYTNSETKSILFDTFCFNVGCQYICC